MKWRLHLLCVLTLVWVCGCSSVRHSAPSADSKSVYVVHRGLHTALVVAQEDIPAGTWPSSRVASEGHWIEIGWGDREGYRYPFTSRIVVRALFWPTPSVLFIRGFDEPLIEDFADKAREIVRVHLSSEGFARMCRYFESFVVHDAEGNPIPLGSDFYEAKTRYHIFHNSNHWAAHALRAGGCPINTLCAGTAGGVIRQSKRCGERIWER